MNINKTFTIKSRSTFGTITLISVFILVFLLLAGLFALLFIWALNTLFGLTIPYNFETIAAALVLIVLFSSNKLKSGD